MHYFADNHKPDGSFTAKSLHAGKFFKFNYADALTASQFPAIMTGLPAGGVPERSKGADCKSAA